jgi:tRNA(Ile)-lysidine synthase
MSLEAEIPWLARTRRSGRWLVAVSGGADSVALLHLLVAEGFRNLVVCHLDHRLRGRASTEDARFVRRLAEKLGVKCEIGRDDVRARMDGESMETAARNARHAFFARCAAKHRCRRILLAHHADDQAETVLWNLLRGSHGMKGMRGEQAITVAGRELLLVRPLLGLRHSELVAWLEERGHRWREDASNHEPVAIRNRLRHEVFPLLDEISGRDSAAAFTRGAEDFAACGEIENAILDCANLLDPQGRLYLPALRKLPPVLQRAALRKFLADRKIPSLDRPLLERAVEMLDPANPAAINLPGGHRLRRRAGRIWIDTRRRRA